MADFSGLTNMPADAPRVSLSALTDEQKKLLFGNSNVEEFLNSTQKPGTPTAADAAKWGIGDNAVAPPDPASLAVKPPMSDLTEQFGAFTRFTPEAEKMGFKNTPLPHARSFAADPAYGVEGAKYANQNMTSDRDPEAQAYMDRASAWAQGNITNSTPGRINRPFADNLTDDQIKKLIADGIKPEQLYQQGRHFRTDELKDAGDVYYDPNATYRLVNKRGGGGTVLQGQGLDVLDQMYEKATALSEKGLDRANWVVEQQDPVTGKWEAVAQDVAQHRSGLGSFADLVLPTVGAFLGGPLGAAAGSALSSAAQGRSLKGTLTRAALAGGTTFAGGQIFGPATSATSGATASGAAATGAAATNAGVNAADDSLINIIANKGIGTVGGRVLGATIGGTAGGTANPPRGDQSFDTTDPANISINAKALPPSLKVNPLNLGAGAGSLVTDPTAPIGTEENPTVGDVTGNKQPPPKNDPITGLPPINVSLPDGTAPQQSPAAPKEETTAQRLSRWANYARLASLGIGVAGSLFGGKGGGSSGKFPKGFGHLADNVSGSSFDSTMPAPDAWANRTPRQLPPQDIRPGRPDQLNYNYTDRGPGWTPPLPGQPDDPRYPSTGKGYAYGGGARAQSLAVRGPGTDRSDSIPAMLSDGEYVVDAPTVRKIGRGSTERGFTKLDDLRVQIHRGRPHRALKSLGARHAAR